MLARRQVYPSSPAQTRRAGPHSPVSGNHSATVRTRRGDTDLLRVALWLAKRGWHVFPLLTAHPYPETVRPKVWHGGSSLCGEVA